MLSKVWTRGVSIILDFSLKREKLSMKVSAVKSLVQIFPLSVQGRDQVTKQTMNQVKFASSSQECKQLSCDIFKPGDSLLSNLLTYNSQVALSQAQQTSSSYPLATKYKLRLWQSWKSPTSRLRQHNMSEKNISSQFKYFPTKSPLLAWKEVTLS